MVNQIARLGLQVQDYGAVGVELRRDNVHDVACLLEQTQGYARLTFANCNIGPLILKLDNALSSGGHVYDK